MSKKVIESRTPLRISFVGGGTDIRDFYSKDWGAVVSTAIDKYVYIMIHERRIYETKYSLKYSQTENVDTIDEIKHPLFREALRRTKFDYPVEIASLATIPSNTGLGSSSAFTVGLLNALYAFQGKYKTPKELAEDAAQIEVDVLKEPIGKQDHYIAACGGLRYFQFNSDESVIAESILASCETKKKLREHSMLFYIGGTRDAKSVLKNQKQKIDEKQTQYTELRDMAATLRSELNNNRLDEFGSILHKGWEIKKQLSDNISDNEIDNLYKSALDAGAIGGKLLGAGGGGFILLYAPPECHANIRAAMGNVKEVEFDFEPEGSKIIYTGD